MVRPLLLVHGITSNARHTFGAPGRCFREPKPESMFSFLVEQGYQAGKTLFWFNYPTLNPILTSARRLQQEISKVQTASGSRAIDLLTFSLGGIISKYYIVSPLYQNEIRRIIMIAPPFLGSPKANPCGTHFRRGRNDLLFPGDSRAFSPQILSFNHPFLLELAGRPFPIDLKTTIIAMKITVGGGKDLRSRYQRLVGARIGEGDLTVPVISTQVEANRHYVVEDSYSPGKVHGFLPNHPEIQNIVGWELMDRDIKDT